MKKTQKIIIWIGIGIVVVVILFIALRFLNTRTKQAQETKKQMNKLEMIHRLNKDLYIQSVSDEIGLIQSDLDATDFSNIDLGLLE